MIICRLEFWPQVSLSKGEFWYYNFFKACCSIKLKNVILGQMVNLLKKVNLPKSQLGKKVNSLKHQPEHFGHFMYCFFGKLTFWVVDFLEVGHFSYYLKLLNNNH